MGRFIPDHFVLDNAQIQPAHGSFSYMDQPLSLLFTLTAKNASGGTTKNYAGTQLAKLDATNQALWPSTILGTNGSFALGAKNGSTNLSTRFEATANPTGSWTAGVANVHIRVRFARLPLGPDGPYDALDIGVAPQDTDGVTLKSAALDLDAEGAGGAERHKLGQTRLRFGRLSSPMLMARSFCRSPFPPASSIGTACIGCSTRSMTAARRRASEQEQWHRQPSLLPQQSAAFLPNHGQLPRRRLTASELRRRRGKVDRLQRRQRRLYRPEVDLSAKPWLRSKWSGFASDWNEDP